MIPKAHALGLWTLAALVAANMIGAGVFTTSGFALGDLGSPFRVLAAWALGGLIAFAGALSYGCLARLIPESGGEYLYLSRTIHPSVGFVAGWISILAGFTGAIAYAALTFAAYALPSMPSHAGNLVASGVIVVAVLMHALRIRYGTSIQNVAVALKLILIAGFSTYAVTGAGMGSWPGLSEVAGGAYTVPPFSLSAFALTVMQISFSYSGFNAAVYLAGEVPDAQKRVPNALLLGTGLTVLVYLVLNAVFVLAPSFEEAAFAPDVAAVAAAAVGGDAMAGAIRIVIALALFTSVSAMVMAGPRVYARMADDGLLPAALGLTGGIPTAAIVVQGVLAVVVVWAAGLQQLLSYLGFTLALSAAAAVTSLFVGARRHRAGRGGLPGYPWAPALYVASTLVFATLAATRNPWEMAAALLTIASGGLVYVFTRGRFHAIQ